MALEVQYCQRLRLFGKIWKYAFYEKHSYLKRVIVLSLLFLSIFLLLLLIIITVQAK
jgi:hypothetical protein